MTEDIVRGVKFFYARGVVARELFDPIAPMVCKFEEWTRAPGMYGAHVAITGGLWCHIQDAHDAWGYYCTVEARERLPDLGQPDGMELYRWIRIVATTPDSVIFRACALENPQSALMLARRDVLAVSGLLEECALLVPETALTFAETEIARVPGLREACEAKLAEGHP